MARGRKDPNTVKDKAETKLDMVKTGQKEQMDKAGG